MSLRCGIVVVVAAAGLLTGVPSTAGASSVGIYPQSGTWHGTEHNGNLPLSFVVASTGKSVGNFIVRVPYSCTPSGSTGTLTFRVPRSVSINPVTGYFWFDTQGFAVPNLTNNVSLQFSADFKGPYALPSGKRATHATNEGVGTNNFTALNGDLCNDRFDTWTAHP